MADGEVAPGKRRRRSSRKRPGTWGEYARSRDFARLVFIGMCLLGAAYTARYLWDTRMASIFYQSSSVAAPAREIRYVWGAPKANEQGGRVYRYEEDGGLIIHRFSEDGLLTSVTCTSDQPGTSACDDALDLKLGDPENAIVLRLGAPSRISYSGDDKILHYDGIGLSFIMRRFRLHGIQLSDGGSFIGYLPVVLWRMIP